MLKISKAKIIKVQTLISNLDLRDEKEDLVRRFSHSRQTSVAELSAQEADRLIAFLEGSTPPTDDAMDQMRKKMLYYGYMMNFDRPRNTNQERMLPKQINYQNIDAWCRSSKSVCPMPLNKMDRQQLATVLTQFEQIYKKTLTALNR